MAIEAEKDFEPNTAACTLAVSPDPVQAGADMTVKAAVTFAPPRDPGDRQMLIFDHEEALAASAALSGYGEGAAETGELTLTAPFKSGQYTWRAMLPAHEDKEGAHPEISGTGTFTVVPHKTRLVVWDVPSAIPAGETFRVKVGVKCSGTCEMTGTRFTVHDHAGALVTGASVSDIWPGSEGLHYAEIELNAPAGEGLFEWEIRVPEPDVEISHAGISASLRLRCVSRPDCAVTVTARDAEKGTPIAGARVVMPPFRARTDAKGVAAFKVPRGTYTLFVSASHYHGTSTPVEVNADYATEADLVAEPAEDLARGYY